MEFVQKINDNKNWRHVDQTSELLSQKIYRFKHFHSEMSQNKVVDRVDQRSDSTPCEV